MVCSGDGKGAVPDGQGVFTGNTVFVVCVDGKRPRSFNGQVGLGVKAGVGVLVGIIGLAVSQGAFRPVGKGKGDGICLLDHEGAAGRGGHGDVFKNQGNVFIRRFDADLSVL